MQFTGIAPGGAGEIFYAIETDYTGGLFEYDLRSGYERRLYHRQQFRAADLVREPKTGNLAMSILANDGTSHLALADANGSRLRQITEGDCFDASPAWSPDGKHVFYQSCGLARSPAGAIIEQAPSTIEMINVETGEISTVIEHPGVDHLRPRVEKDGSICFIRRPYERRRSASFKTTALDTLLFPFRLVRMVVHFLNFMSLMFARKPMLTSGGPPTEGPDARHLLILGRVIDAEKALRRGGKIAALVPKDSEFVRQSKDGAQVVLAGSVVTFDVGANGDILFSDGSSIFLINAGGQQKIGEGHLIDRVALIVPPA